MSYALSAAGVAFGASLYSSYSSAKAGQASADRSSISYNQSYKKQMLQAMVRNSYKAGLLNVQLGLDKQKAVQGGFDIGAQGKAMLGVAEAQAAATGSVGASVDAVTNDIQMKVGEAQAQNAMNYEQMLTNYNNELEALSINATSEALSSSPASSQYSGPSTGAMLGQALLAGASTYLQGTYSRQLKLGLGEQVSVGATSRISPSLYAQIHGGE